MKNKKRINNEKDFRIAKYFFAFSRFFGSAVSAYVLYQSILLCIMTYKKSQIFGFIIVLSLSLLFIYLTIALAKQGVQTAKAKKLQDLP